MVVLDSERTLFRLDSEDESAEWYRKVEPFISQLNGVGVAVILLHHPGKGGSQRGTSAREDPADNIFYLKSVANRDPRKPHFTISADDADGGKQRGTYFKPFTLRFHQPEDGTTEWESDGGGPAGRKDEDWRLRRVAALLRGGRTQAEIAEQFRVHEGTISRDRTFAEREGYMTRKGRPTQKGWKLMQQYQEGDDDED